MEKILQANLSYLEAQDPKLPLLLPDYSQDYVSPIDYAEISIDLINDLKNISSLHSPILGEEFENDDASWIMGCTFMIFTMQTGIGLVESGMCSMKNEVTDCSLMTSLN